MCPILKHQTAYVSGEIDLFGPQTSYGSRPSASHLIHAAAREDPHVSIKSGGSGNRQRIVPSDHMSKPQQQQQGKAQAQQTKPTDDLRGKKRITFTKCSQTGREMRPMAECRRSAVATAPHRRCTSRRVLTIDLIPEPGKGRASAETQGGLISSSAQLSRSKSFESVNPTPPFDLHALRFSQAEKIREKIQVTGGGISLYLYIIRPHTRLTPSQIV